MCSTAKNTLSLRDMTSVDLQPQKLFVNND